MASDHDALLDRVLPHVRKYVISDAQRAIAELDWEDSDSHSADHEVDRPSVTSLSALTRTNSTSELSHTGRSGGLSPPRRPLTFSNFDSAISYHHMADDDSSVVSTRPVSRAKNPARSVPDPELSEGGGHRKKAMARAAHTTVSGPPPSHPRTAVAGAEYDSFDVPPRQSSKNGASVPASTGDAGRGRGRLILEEPATEDAEREDEEEDDDDRGDEDEQPLPRGTARVHAASPAPPATSSTPPPILNTRPNRVIVYENFKDQDSEYDDDVEAEDEGREPLLATLGTPVFEASHRPPLTSKNNERRPHSRNSDRPRTNHSGPYTRTAALAMDHRGLRTPMLNHVQLYQDAESKRPIMGRPSEDRATRAPFPKGYRSVDDNTHNGHPAGPQQEYTRNMSLRRSYSEDELSIRQPAVSIRTTGTNVSQSAMPDFFSSSIFQVVLHNPTTACQLLKFSETRLCAENVEFLTKVDEYRSTLNNLASQMAQIHKSFISPGSASQIHVNGGLLRRAHKEMKSLINQAFPSMENVFTDLQEQIETLVFQDVYPRFVRHQLALSASRALGSDRFKYQGLGDCFCLTNPNIADNPIVFASDGFVKVTGYARPEIIPRNCRFLQGAHTDRQAVQRLKKGIQDKKETVELLLNYKKNGEPFWNLLYVAPLYNARGKTDFFIGGQVNCSTTIHSNADVMRVLSTSESVEPEEDPSLKPAVATRQPLLRPSARKALLKAFGVRQDEQIPVVTGDPGMENGVLSRMEGQELSAQMKEFYTAYSKYLVVRASSFTIEFYSEGVVEALNPANMAGTMVAGSDVFRFFGQNMLGKQSDYKTRVRNAIRVGSPVSTGLRLQTRRSAVFRGDESFMAHWTPLKDEKAVVHWVVVTLAPTV